MKRLAFALFLIFMQAGSAWAGWDDADAALERGDYETAVREYRTLAEKGDAEAQFNLGLLYRVGEGIPRDDHEAARWFRRAAEQGLAAAQANLGTMYGNGTGVPLDLTETYFWLSLAAANGYQPATKWRDKAAQNLTPEGLAAVQERTKSWRPTDERLEELLEEARRSQHVEEPQTDQEKPRVEAEKQAKKEQDPIQEPPTVRPSSESLVWTVQQQLAQRGYLHSPADGIAGPKTRAAIRTFQRDRSLPDNGEMSRSLLEELEKAPRMAYITSVERQELEEVKTGGSGFIVTSTGLVLTNHQVVEGCDSLRVSRNNGEAETDAAVTATDPANDLALITLDEATGRPATFRDGRGISQGDGINAMGYHLYGLLARQASVTTGVVSALAGPGRDRRFLQITAPVQPGNSGGPLFDRSSNVVGVVVGKLDASMVAVVTGDIPQNVNFAINASVARTFMDAHDVDYETAASEEVLSFSDIAERAQRSTVLVECLR
jgi:S1-C subfamily serine protease